MKVFFLSDKGLVRSRNEDSGGVFMKGSQCLAVVADGMGGHRAGDVASQKTVQYIKDSWEAVEEPLTGDSAEAWLTKTINEINSLLFAFAAGNEECKGMGTTIVAAIASEKNLVISHVGDSRAYLFYADREEAQVTEDHTLVQELINHGQLKREDAFNHPKKNIVMRALGTEETTKIDTTHLPFPAGSELLICSDGLSDKLTSKQLNEIFNKKDSPSTTGKNLVQEALRLGGEDNITVALILNEPGEAL